MSTEFPQSEKFSLSAMHSPSRDTRARKRVITIIKGNASASTQRVIKPLMHDCTLKNHTYASMFYIRILGIFNSVVPLKV